ncbi:MAG: LEPR-XLL domain-containing protein, partial [Limisphaerales bacterium]
MANQRKHHLEQLEQRVLLSADVSIVSVAAEVETQVVIEEENRSMDLQLGGEIESDNANSKQSLFEHEGELLDGGDLIGDVVEDGQPATDTTSSGEVLETVDLAEPVPLSLGDESAFDSPDAVTPLALQPLISLASMNGPPIDADSERGGLTVSDVHQSDGTLLGVSSLRRPASLSSGSLQAFIESKLGEYRDNLITGDQLFMLGTSNLGGFLGFSNLTLSFESIAYQSATDSFTGAVQLSAASASLFGDREFAVAVSDSDSDTDSFAAVGSYAAGSKTYSLSLDDAVLTVGESIRVQSSNINVSYDSKDNATDQELATIGSANISSSLIGGLSVETASWTIRKSGFEIGSVTLSPQGGVVGIDGLLEFNQASLAVADLDVAYGSGTAVTGSVTLTASSGRLYPSVASVSSALTSFNAQFEFSGANPSGDLILTVGELVLTVGDAFRVRGTGVTIEPGNIGVIATISSADVSSPLFEGLSATVSGFELRRDGFSVDGVTMSSAAVHALGDVMSVQGVTITVENLVLNQVAAGGAYSGSVTANVGGVTFFPNLSFLSSTVTGLAAVYDFGSGAASLGRMKV